MKLSYFAAICVALASIAPVQSQKPAVKPGAAKTATKAQFKLSDALFLATRARDLRRMEELLKRGVSANARSTSLGKQTPIFVAIKAQSLPAVRLLVKHGANIDAGVYPGSLIIDPRHEVPGVNTEMSVLDYATYLNRVQIVKYLLQIGARSPGENKTAQVFKIAAYCNALEIMRMLLKVEPANRRARNASSALMNAVYRGHLEMAKLLISNGANISVCNDALLKACEDGNLELASTLLKAGADPNTKWFRMGDGDEASKDLNGNSLLIILIHRTWLRFDSVEDLPYVPAKLSAEERKAAQKWVDESIATRKKVVDLIRVILAKGVKPDALSTGGYTALLLAIEKGDGDFVQALLDGGANPNFAPPSFPSPLRFLAQTGNLGRLDAQLTRYDDGSIIPEQRDKVRNRLAAEDLAIAQMLIDKGADLKSGDNRLALGEAAWRGNTALLQFLLQKGADPNLVFVPMRHFMTPVHRELVKTAYEAAQQEKEEHRLNAEYYKTLREAPVLQMAAAAGNLESVRALLAAGANAKARDTHGLTALDALAVGGRTSSIGLIEWNSALLAEQQINGELSEPHEIIKPLPAADMSRLTKWAAEGDRAIATALVENGCDVTSHDVKGDSTLKRAALQSDLAVVDVLLKAGAKPAQDTAIFDIIQKGRRQIRVAPSLTKLQIDLTEADRSDMWYRDDMKSLQVQSKAEAKRGRIKAFAQRAYLLKLWGEKDAAIVERLIQYGANVNAKNADGLTPLMLAARQGQIEVVRSLLKAGADVGATNRSGQGIAMQVSQYGSAQAKLPLKQKPTYEAWLKPPAMKRREALIRQTLRREDNEILQLLKQSAKN